MPMGIPTATSPSTAKAPVLLRVVCRIVIAGRRRSHRDAAARGHARVVPEAVVDRRRTARRKGPACEIADRWQDLWYSVWLRIPILMIRPCAAVPLGLRAPPRLRRWHGPQAAGLTADLALLRAVARLLLLVGLLSIPRCPASLRGWPLLGATRPC